MGEQTEYARRVVDLIKEYDLEDIRKFPYAAHYVMGIAARKIERITAQLEQVTRERDAAANDLYYVGSPFGEFCSICKYSAPEECEERKLKHGHCWEWRGVEELDK